MSSMYLIKDKDIERLSISEQLKLKKLLSKINIGRQKFGDQEDKDMSKIKIRVTDAECMPTRAHRWDAGWDLKAAEEVTIPAGGAAKVHTGVHFEIPSRHCGMVLARSSMGTKHRITLANDVGIIDSEYRGEIMVFLVNDSTEDYTINQYDRFAQIIITPVNASDLWVVDKLSDTERGDGGFGSSGVTSGRLSGTKENKSNVPKTEQEALEGLLDTIEDSSKAVEALKAAKSELIPGSMVYKLEAQPELHPASLVIPDELPDELLNELVDLCDLLPSDYLKLKKSGKLFEVYPEATGNMQEDLNIGK